MPIRRCDFTTLDGMRAVRWLSAHLETSSDLADARTAFWFAVSGCEGRSFDGLAPPAANAICAMGCVPDASTPAAPVSESKFVSESASVSRASSLSESSSETSLNRGDGAFVHGGDPGHTDVAVLSAPKADPYLSMGSQQLSSTGVTPVLHGKTIESLVKDGSRTGGRVIAQTADDAVLSSPGGLLWRAATWRGQKRVPPPIEVSPPLFDGVTVPMRIDQLTLNVPTALFDDELEYWANLLGWKVIDGAMPEFAVLVDKGMPLRLMLHRDPFADSEDGVTAHLDISGGALANVERLVAWHVSLGARLGVRHPWWITMTDPAGMPYCLNRRDPITGAIQVR